MFLKQPMNYFSTMGQSHAEITPELAAWILAQKLFFVATAPLSSAGHVNLSPKGLDSFRVLGPREVAYLDLTGSGAETMAHLRENGRITVMFCAFEGPPRILRLFGRGETHALGSEAYRTLQKHFPELPGARAIVRIEVEQVRASCGWGVPLFAPVGDRSLLPEWSEKKGDEGLEAYRREKNRLSLDGLPSWE
jgi:hypothetical protein